MSIVKEDSYFKHPGWELLFFGSEVAIIAAFALTCTVDGGSYTDNAAELGTQNDAAAALLLKYYPMWMDVHVMIFIGFGFLMVFLKTHSWTSIGFNYLVAAWAMQCCVLFQGFWKCVIVHGFDKKIDINLVTVIEAEFCAAACLITMGALLGKCTFP